MMKPKNQRVALATFLGRRLKNTPPQQQIIKLFAAFSILFFLPLISWADGETTTFDKDNLTYTVIDETNRCVSVSAKTGVTYSGTLTIPKTVENNNITYTVTKIDNSYNYGAFMYAGMSAVIIPNTITSIGSQAFYGCNNLACNTDGIDANLKYIGTTDNPYYALITTTTITNWDQSPSTVRINDRCRIISGMALYRYHIEQVIIPDSVMTVGVSAFASCSNLKEVIIGNSVKTIEAKAFANCAYNQSGKTFTVISLPANPPALGENVFVTVDGSNTTTVTTQTKLYVYNTSNYTNWSNTFPSSVINSFSGEVEMTVGKWNFVAGSGLMADILNTNVPNSYSGNYNSWTYGSEGDITSADYKNCDMAALGYNYGTDGNNWNTTYMYSDEVMHAGEGYFVWPFKENAHGTEVTSDNNITKMSGTLLPTGTITVNKTNEGTANASSTSSDAVTAKWVALGNPFSAAIPVSTLVGTTSSTTGAAISNVQGGVIYTFNNASGDNGQWETPSSIVAAGQGFMIAIADGQNSISATMTYPTTTSKAVANMDFGIKINCLANNMTSTVFAKQVANGSDGFDVNDAYALLGSSENLVEPYFVVDGRQVWHNRYASDNYVCDISFHAQRQATAKISVSDVPQEYVVSILDLAMGTETVLDENSFFEIDVEQGENAGRYKIKITKGALSVADVEKVSDVNIWNNKGNIYVSGKDLKSVEVLNTLGQSMMMKQVGGNEYNFNFNDEGTYIIRVKSNSGTKTQKVVLTK